MSIESVVQQLGDDTERGFTATTEPECFDDGHTTVYELWTSSSLEEVRAAVAKHFDRTECGHSYDCCGCWFRMSTRTISEFDREGVAYIIIDQWARNI